MTTLYFWNKVSLLCPLDFRLPLIYTLFKKDSMESSQQHPRRKYPPFTAEMTSTFIAFWEDVAQHRPWRMNNMGRPNSIDFCDELATLLESQYGITYSVYHLRDKLNHFRIAHTRGKPFARPYAASLEIINKTLESRRRLWELHTAEIPETMDDPEKIKYDLEICGLTMEEMMDVARYLATRQGKNKESGSPPHHHPHHRYHHPRMHFHHHICSHFPPPGPPGPPHEIPN